MKKFYTLLLSLFTLTAWSQDIPMQVIAAGGGYFENSGAGISISFTIGEVAYTTLTSGNFILTQGFQQGNLFTTSIDKPVNAVNDIAVYPNPATDYVKVRIDIPNLSGKATYDLHDITGKKVITKEFNVETSVPVELSLSDIRPGIYLLKVYVAKENLVRVVKLVKE